MAGFGVQRRQVGRKAPRSVVFTPAIFADTWRERPTEDVAVGLRVPSDHEVSLARANAAQTAWQLHPSEGDEVARIACVSDALMRELCALAMCDVNNVHEPYFPTPEEDVRTRLTSEGVKRVFDEIERLVLETSPVHRQATRDECTALAARLLESDALEQLPAFRAQRVRRLLAFVHDELLPVGDAP